MKLEQINFYKKIGLVKTKNQLNDKELLKVGTSIFEDNTRYLVITDDLYLDYDIFLLESREYLTVAEYSFDPQDIHNLLITIENSLKEQTSGETSSKNDEIKPKKQVILEKKIQGFNINDFIIKFWNLVKPNTFQSDKTLPFDKKGYKKLLKLLGNEDKYQVINNKYYLISDQEIETLKLHLDDLKFFLDDEYQVPEFDFRYSLEDILEIKNRIFYYRILDAQTADYDAWQWGLVDDKVMQEFDGVINGIHFNDESTFVYVRWFLELFNHKFKCDANSDLVEDLKNVYNNIKYSTLKKEHLSSILEFDSLDAIKINLDILPEGKILQEGFKNNKYLHLKVTLK
ncbi:hypothetical protein [Mycoplasma sp. OR1901]|uniref:hypothetical protein n=1 Tax=Mycoplasma sp. OR1901 TaxID=2742195 RepID=UPI001582CA7A|nr:hypothetical protein [Mycoplasma sp. OR1901]QKT05432.1 hypothetical protein HTZ87_01810 [Mycoplasma sp. OR1901]